MEDKKKPEPAPADKNKQLSEKELDKVSGGADTVSGPSTSRTNHIDILS